MKADPSVQRQLLELASVDAELARVAHRRRNLPELAEIEDIEKSLRDKRDALVNAQTSTSDLQREVGRQEKEVEAVRARADRDRKLMESGSAGAKQLTELEHELQTLARRQQVLEDDQLELMERREAADIEVQRAAAEVDRAEQDLADATTRRDEAIADLDATQARREADRAALAPTFPEPLLKTYDRVREQRGIGAAMLRARKCEACRLELDRSQLSEIKGAAEDDVVTCENCSAILVRTPESGL
ncbi:hypothetical protein BJF85_22555 [Saccharomonospora sp. CUA-673]|uniref:zinc ribbon domain-containing protein n=1 Tax=Saccharomonospora sp. CUA-673 TaxID=1904969 RepID=UPI00095E118B|nr:C4-type zinc ribbon domain-containing protein [Saccharomonospora sp. CUA-673]OLT42506.1 hypothetical protein BJF85_22555 [Saccharomonospora sp. CUA-673]